MELRSSYCQEGKTLQMPLKSMCPPRVKQLELLEMGPFSRSNGFLVYCPSCIFSFMTAMNAASVAVLKRAVNIRSQEEDL